MKLVTFIYFLLYVYYRANITPHSKRHEGHLILQCSNALDAIEDRQNRRRCVGHAIHTVEMVNARKISVGNHQGKSQLQNGRTDVRIVLKLITEQKVLRRTKRVRSFDTRRAQ
jgi:hypothetical protein